MDTFWDYIIYRHLRPRSIRKQTPISPVLLRVGLIFYLALSLSGAVLIADTVLHYTTSTIELDDVSRSAQLGESGRGLSEECLQLSRIDNSGYPCSRNIGLSASDPNAYLREQSEMFYLRHNTSQTSEIRLVPAQGSESTDVVLLIPKSSTLSPFVDYRASTIGITTSCEPITDKCQFGVWGANDAYSGFYCSPYFYGVLGKTAIIANDSTTTDDPDIPPLSSKISPNLQIAFFTDQDLEIPYNTRAYDLTTGKVNTSIPLLPDDELVNEVWVAIAGRVPTSALQADSELTGDPNFFMGPNLLLDSVIRCRYRSLDVEYTWFNGTVQNVQFQNSTNGTISELYHGYRTPTSVSGTNPTLLDILSQAAMQATTADFCRTWANLLSGEIMSVVGGVTTPRSNTIQQDRVPQLVVKIWVPSLVWLLFCCLMYPVAGLILTILAAQTSREHYIGAAVSRVSLHGFAEQGFADQHNDSVVETSTGEGTEDDTVRVGFGDDLRFKKWPMEARSATHVNTIGVD
ncbi:hypothetical protein LTR84_006628 [Exophiala bonariae]|uniref:Uncharacterized protein n=1 Tax=Exophiala bonariae TaxID=1690606 RepID=A0AAV9N0L0_9EURO|nr:hypothetical protein LTR84_006628 [Exophiala bonariae]